MTASTSLSVSQNGQRLLSLDFLRGVIMVILMLGETGIFFKLYVASPNSFTHLLATQFEHSQWHGLHFWDLLLPAFMFIAGTAMALSYKKQKTVTLYMEAIFFENFTKKLLVTAFGGFGLCSS